MNIKYIILVLFVSICSCSAIAMEYSADDDFEQTKRAPRPNSNSESLEDESSDEESSDEESSEKKPSEDILTFKHFEEKGGGKAKKGKTKDEKKEYLKFNDTTKLKSFRGKGKKAAIQDLGRNAPIVDNLTEEVIIWRAAETLKVAKSKINENNQIISDDVKKKKTLLDIALPKVKVLHEITKMEKFSNISEDSSLDDTIKALVGMLDNFLENYDFTKKVAHYHGGGYNKKNPRRGRR